MSTTNAEVPLDGNRGGTVAGGESISKRFVVVSVRRRPPTDVTA